MSQTADLIINNVRDVIPDPVYTSGVPQPSTDGNLFYAATLYRFTDQAVKVTARLIGWQIEDWFPMAVVANQAAYSVDSKWHQIKEVFKDRYRLLPESEGNITWPSGSTSGKSLWYAIHRVTDHFDITPFPIPSNSDPVPTLSANIGTTDAIITVSSTTNFLSPGGFCQIDSEIIYYSAITATTLTGCLRAQSGTAAATHAQNANVTCMNLWVKGPRSPQGISLATSVIELLPSYLAPIEKYVLALCRRAENEHAEARSLMQEFNADVKAIHDDAQRQVNQGTQIKAYGSEYPNNLVFGRLIVP